MNSIVNLLAPPQSHRNGNGSNPYIGPRTFTRADAHRFFGREREARELLALVSSERVVLFYAQSGAGKSSLINARLIPQLEREGFEVLPVSRVSGRTLPMSSIGEKLTTQANIFAFNLMLSLDQTKREPQYFANLSLADFLINLNRIDSHYAYTPAGEAGEYRPSDISTDLTPDPPVLTDDADEANAEELVDTGDRPPLETQEIWPRVMIIDQFEEILITNLHAWEQRTGFFDQVHQAMEMDPFLYLVLVMREDYVAALDPYAHRLPGNLRTRYYMERMAKDAALQAVRQPAAAAGRPFAPGVAETLVDNLAQMRIESVDGADDRYAASQFIEPVQLQVVCYQLWEALRDKPGEQITEDDLLRLARGRNLARFVDHALSNFYEQALEAVLAEPEVDISERTLRRWFSTQMITESGTRGFVHQGDETTGDLPNPIVYQLQNRFLIRAESRAGALWYELVHDRFIQPILQSNRMWENHNVRPLLNDAEAWRDSDRNPDKLYEGPQLQEAIDLVAANPKDATEVEQQFIDASQRQNRRHVMRARLLLIGTLTVVGVLMGLVILGWMSWNRAERARQNAQNANATITVVLATSNKAQMRAQNDADTLALQATELAASEAVAQEALSTVEFLVEELQNALVQQAAVTPSASGEATESTGYSPATSPPSDTDTPDASAATESAQSSSQEGTEPNDSEANNELDPNNDGNEEAAAPVSTTVAAASGTTIGVTTVPATTVIPGTVVPTTAVPGTAAPGTPSPTATPTPNSIATATAVAQELTNLYARQTATVQSATSEAYSCLVNVDSLFRNRWTYSTLGCPQTPAQTVWAAWQPYQRGSMLWRSDNELNYVFPDGLGWFTTSGRTGEGISETLRGVPPSSDLVIPAGRFLYTWLSQDRIFNNIGWATAEEGGFCARIQDFEQGFLLSSVEGSCAANYNNANDGGWLLNWINAFANNRWSISYYQ